MDVKKLIVTIVALGLGIGGALWGFDMKGAVCGTAEVPAQAK